MKKSLLALAVLGSFAAAAQAQNVQLYGTIDASFDQSDVKGFRVDTAPVNATATNSGAGLRTTAVVNPFNRDLTRQGNADHFASSVLGIRGTEDLGKGLKGAFQLEGDLNANNGNGDASGGLTFDRHSYIAVGYDEAMVKIGRSDDLAKRLTKYTFGANMFDPVSPSGDVTTTELTTAIVTNLANAIGDADLVAIPFGTQPYRLLKERNPNSIFLDGKVAGLNYGFAYSNDVAAPNGGDVQGASRMSLAAEYDFGVASLGAAYISADSVRQSNVTINNAQQNGILVVGAGKIDGFLIAAKTNLFGATLGASYYSDDQELAGLVGKNEQSGYQFSVQYPLGAGFAVEANYLDSEIEFKDTAIGSLKGEQQNYGLVLSKSFSKRTGAYVGYRDSEAKVDGDKVEQTLFVVGAYHRF